MIDQASTVSEIKELIQRARRSRWSGCKDRVAHQGRKIVDATISPITIECWAPYVEKVPVTPPLSLMQQLNASLDLIDSMGEGGVYRRRREVAETIRNLVRDAGLEIYAKRCGDGITAVIAPQEMDIGRFCRRLEQDYSILIEGGPGRLSGQIFRIGHVGHLTDDELQYFCDSFKKALAAETSR